MCFPIQGFYHLGKAFARMVRELVDGITGSRDLLAFVYAKRSPEIRLALVVTV